MLFAVNDICIVALSYQTHAYTHTHLVISFIE